MEWLFNVMEHLIPFLFRLSTLPGVSFILERGILSSLATCLQYHFGIERRLFLQANSKKHPPLKVPRNTSSPLLNLYWVMCPFLSQILQSRDGMALITSEPCAHPYKQMRRHYLPKHIGWGWEVCI